MSEPTQPTDQATPSMPSIPIAGFEEALKLQMDAFFQKYNTSVPKPQEQALQNSGGFEIAKNTVKVPTFLPSAPDLWFLQIEAQFRRGNIVRDQTKYDTVLASLDVQCLEAIADIIRDPPSDGKFESIKQRIISEYSDSSQQKLRKLLQGVELGDLKPSTLLRKMRDLAGSSMSDDTVESLWLSKLPDTTRAIVASITVDLNSKAATADKITELGKFETSSSECSVVNTMGQLSAQVNELSRRLDQMSTRPRSPSRNGQRDRNRSSSRDRNSNRARDSSREPRRLRYDLCWYHYRFGERATKCQDGCKYQSPNSKN